MKKSEAYQLLGLSESATKEEAKKAFKKLAAKHHPDVNKDPASIDTFKKINSAYQAIESNKFEDSHPFNPFSHAQGPSQGGWDISDFFNVNFGGGFKQQIIMEDIHLERTISFKESVLGTQLDLSYKRNIQCQDCQGEGVTKTNNCSRCKGKGHIYENNKNMFFAKQCPECKAKFDEKDCIGCNATGFMNSQSSVTVRIPAGVVDKNVLRLNGMGNFYGSFAGSSSAYLKIRVTPEPGLSLVDGDVMSEIEISLLEALEGCKKKINTIDGFKEVEVKSLIKNQEEIILPNMGANRSGKQRVIVKVSYPDDVAQLIKNLKDSSNAPNPLPEMHEIPAPIS
jgi:molecular chaperone DnaJ